MTRIGILVVAYNAATTLHQVLDRIPADFRPRIEQVLVSDDASTDATHLVALGYQHRGTDLPLTVMRQERNLGYGGNQKVGYRWAIEHDLDVVVLLHADGQYAPEHLPRMVEPLVRGDADAVFGSRMLERGAALRGGMPRYKYLGNRILTAFQNRVLGAHLSEWHSGYRAYAVDALRRVDFERNSDDFDFDTEIIIELLDAGQRIVEIPIPTFYGDELSRVNGLRYAAQVTADVVRHRLGRMGFGPGPGEEGGTYEEKHAPDSSHSLLLRHLEGRSPGRLLDLGCADGFLGARLRRAGWNVTGLDIEERPEVHERLDRFVKADLDEGLPPEVGGEYDVVLAADVFEHLREPERLLRALLDTAAPGGTVVTSIPNVAHWYPRLRVASGRFDYDRRGILDRSHLRFFTRRSFERLAASCGWDVRLVDVTGLPLDILDRGRHPQRSGRLRRAVGRVDRAGVDVWPTLFGYQFLFELRPAAQPRRIA